MVKYKYRTGLRIRVRLWPDFLSFKRTFDLSFHIFKRQDLFLGQTSASLAFHWPALILTSHAIIFYRYKSHFCPDNICFVQLSFDQPLFWPANVIFLQTTASFVQTGVSFGQSLSFDSPYFELCSRMIKIVCIFDVSTGKRIIMMIMIIYMILISCVS